MANTAIENQPIIVDLIQSAKDTGWSIDGNIASHVSCNPGNIILLPYPLITGHTYQVSYSILTISGGILQLHAGNTTGISRSTTGLFVETILATGTNPILYFFSNANCTVQQFNVGDTIVNNSNKQQNTICYSVQAQKWSDFRTFAPDFGFSLFTKTYTLYQGNLYGQINNSVNRNNFYGFQYVSIIKFTTNQQPSITKRYNSLNYQANQLLIAPSMGVTTSGGQVSELIAVDFLQQTLNDGVNPIVNDYQIEGLYQANFLRDLTFDLINGPQLIGNYMTVELQTTAPSGALKLFTTEIIYIHSSQGVR